MRVTVVFNNASSVEVEFIEDGLEWVSYLDQLTKENGKIAKVIYPSGYEWIPKN